MTTKDRVLETLERQRGRHFSGEELAAVLGVSRTAVWKAVAELREAGYPIGAATNRGYCLSPDSNLLSVQGMAPFLEDDSALGRVSVYREVDSTNATAKELAVAGAVHGTAVLSDSQRAGRGRRGRAFYSPAGTGVYLSVILRPRDISVERSPLVTAAAAVAVCRAVEQVSPVEAAIKWVNDIFVAGKKVCGILTEAVADFETGGVDCLVVGMGVNVDAGAFPQELREIAGDIRPHGRPVNRNQLAACLYRQVLAVCGGLPEHAFLEEYRRRSLVLGNMVEVWEGGERRYPARALDIDGEGRLVVETADGGRRSLGGGEVRITPLSTK